MTSPTGSAVERLDCGDNGCEFAFDRKPGGMRTNGGCRCLKNLEVSKQADDTPNWVYTKAAMRKVRREMQLLAASRREALARAESAEQKLAAANARVEELTAASADAYRSLVLLAYEMQKDNKEKVRHIGMAQQALADVRLYAPAAQLEDEPEEERGDEE